MSDIVVADTVAAAIRSAEKNFGEREAVLDRGRRISYAELADRVRQVAGALIANGIGPGDRVCLWAPNRLEWMLAALGSQYLGAVMVPINTRYRGAEAVDVVARTRARLLVVDQTFLGNDYVQMLRTAAAERSSSEPDQSPAEQSRPDRSGERPISGLPDLSMIVNLADEGPECLPWPAFLASSTSVPAEQVEALADRVNPDDVCDILFTSGTTGRSKGAMASHRQALGMAQGWAERAQLTTEDRYLIANPFFHNFGYKAGYLACLLSGALVVPQSVFDAGAVLDLVERERITVLPGPPAIYQALLEDASLPDRDLTSLRLAVTGAAMVPQTLVRRMGTELRISCTLTAYGLTEAPVVTMCVEDDDVATVATTCGRPLDWAQVQTVGPDGPTAPGTPGEVLIRGPHVMLGYLDDPESTAAAIDADGWLHTGDVGILDERGYLRITDRITDMFTVGGFNVYPAELEQVITAHPAVRDCAVIGVPDERLGEVGRAYVCTRREMTLDVDELLAYCRERLANFKVPRSVVLVDELPRNAGGKVVKSQLRQRALGGQ
ncbi:MAG TPA: AMP-binding protein [Kineosporiaceae bacterium]|nr:AMP-binding protein [Kineosporiaceae bacterium]